MIDFSKGPEGATHYGLDSHSVIYFLKINDRYFYDNGSKWIDSPYCHHDWLKPIQKTTNGEKMNIEINMNNMIECKTDREVMLCEQVLRMCRGEERQKLINGNWCPSFSTNLCIDSEYRAKPKKELIVPWEFISDEINYLLIESNEIIIGLKSTSQIIKDGLHISGLKLDLEGIDLPTAIKRP